MTPSSMSPSEAMHPDGVVERALAAARRRGRAGRARARAAIAMPDRARQALAERAGGDLDAGGVPVLGVSGRLGAPRAQRLQVVELQAVARQVELDVQRQAGVPAREHEPVAAQPVRVGRVVPQSAAGTAGRRPGPGSSPCRGGRCRPSGRRRRPAPARCRRRGRSRSVQVSGSDGMWTRGQLRQPSRHELTPEPADPEASRAPAGCGLESGPLDGVAWAHVPEPRPTRRDALARAARPPASSGRGRVTDVDPSHRAPVPPVRLRPRRGRSARAATGSARYVALTKPRIIELLLVTTVPTMLLAAGRVPVARPGAGDPRRRHAWRRQRRTPSTATSTATSTRVMQRTRARPLVTGEVRPREALVFGVALGVVAVALARAARQRALGRARAGRDPVLRLRLHARPQAADAAEHRLGRRRRLHARADRLVGGDELAVVGGGRAVRRDLPLDAAALLAAVDALPRRLRRGRRADARRRRAPGRRGPSDRRPTRGRWWPARCCWCRWRRRGRCTPWRPSLLGAWFLVEAHLLLAPVSRATAGDEPATVGAMRVFHVSITYLTLLFVAVGLDPFVRF